MRAACRIAVLMAAVLCALTVKAREKKPVWFFESPKADSMVKSGELFVLVKYDQRLKIMESSVQVYLDNRLISNQVKITDDKISMLYLLPLKPGKHVVEVRAKSLDYGWLQPVSTTFNVQSATVGPDGRKIRSDHKTFGLVGQVASDFQIENISGPGSALRQEVPFTRNTYLNLNGKIGSFNIPVSGFLTTDQYTYASSMLPRNTFRIGITGKGLEGYYGDLNPNLDRLVWPGTRIHGAKVGIKGKRAGVQYLDGYMQTAAEGRVLSYTSAYGLPPTSLQDDSTFIDYGQYKRRVSALNASFGNPLEGALTGISIMRAYDQINSITYGISPKDNFVFGLQQSFVTNEQKMKVTGGIAYSLFTNDASSGPISKKIVDSIYGVDLPVDPLKAKNFFVVNTSTYQPGKPSAAGFINMALKAKYFVTTLEYKYMGSSYRSLANPYLRTDLRLGGIQEQIYTFKKKLNFTLKYNYQVNNIAKSQLTTIGTHTGSGSVYLSPGEKWPQVTFIYNTQYRVTVFQATSVKFGAANDNYNSYTGNINYYFNAFGARHGINLLGSRIQRNNLLYNDRNLTDMGSIGVSEDIIPINIIINLHYSTLFYTSQIQARQPLYNMYGGGIAYRFKKIKSELGVNYGMTSSYGSVLGLSSKRPAYSGRLKSEIIKNFSLDVECGITPYNDLNDSANNYNEFFTIVRLGYNFNL